MSIQLGQWNATSRAEHEELTRRVVPLVRAYGPDHFGSYENGGIHLSYAALCTTKESRAERQPYISTSGCVLTWDGRLDNREDLIAALRIPKESDPTDVSIVADAYQKWGDQAFPRLLGDWALAIWNPTEHCVVLAKDFLGLRRLYYAQSGSVYRWCSLLEPLILLEERSLSFCREYLAGCFGAFPATHLTPYRDLLSVSPGTYTKLRLGSVRTHHYWSFDSGRRLRYASDSEYEEHFRAAFAQSVARRPRSDRPVLAELSGGLDSSSIVCVADALSTHSPSTSPQLDTLSYFDDGEPNWQEREYFQQVEKQRGRTGLHIDLSTASPLTLSGTVGGFTALPGDIRENHPAAKRFRAHLRAEGYRVVLSGIGGDEVTGGKPTPVPELADLLARAHSCQFVRQLYRWSLYQKKPWIQLLREVLSEFMPRALRNSPQCAPWVNSRLGHEQDRVLDGYRGRIRFFIGLPSFQENLMTLDALKRQLSSEPLLCDPPYERRFPFLDRDLLEFLYSIPREQLVRPGQRRSLLRRALRGIVPGEILNRRRKSFVARAPIVFICEEWERVCELGTNMVANSLGLVSESMVARECWRARQGVEVAMAALLRTLSIECWLRSVRDAKRPNGTAIVECQEGVPDNKARRQTQLPEFS
jgi:asparagine synthase (glutamine-hydrolysing)